MQFEYSEPDNNIRLTQLIGTGESVVRRGGRMVQNVLEITVIPVYSHLGPAETILLAA